MCGWKTSQIECSCTTLSAPTSTHTFSDEFAERLKRAWLCV